MNDSCREAFGLPVTLTAFGDAAPPPGSEREFDVVRQWAKDWLSRSHPDLGRAGAVCPFLDTAMKKDLLRVAFVRGDNIDHDRLVSLVTEIAEDFFVLAPVDGPGSIYKAVLVVFPELTDFTQVDAVQDRCKTAFVERGLMVGQFYPGHQKGGLHNPDFKPLDAPLPMLAVRTMVASDYPFLCGNDRWMAAYIARFAPDLSVTSAVRGRQELWQPEAR